MQSEVASGVPGFPLPAKHSASWRPRAARHGINALIASAHPPSADGNIAVPRMPAVCQEEISASPLAGFPSLDRRGPGMDRDLTGRADRQSRLKAPLQLHAL